MSDLTNEPQNPSSRPARKAIPLASIEQKISYFAVYLAAALVALEITEYIRNVPTVNTITHTKGKACPAGYKLVGLFCEHATHQSRNSFLVLGIYIAVAAIFITLFARRGKRAGVVVASIMLGFPLGTAGIAFFFLGAWLVMRALRMQRYGDASFFGSQKLAKEASRERRNRRAQASSSSPARTVPEPSKRYTPKKQRRNKK